MTHKRDCRRLCFLLFRLFLQQFHFHLRKEIKQQQPIFCRKPSNAEGDFLRNLSKQKGYIANHLQSAFCIVRSLMFIRIHVWVFDKSSNKGQVSRDMGPYNDYWLSFSFFPKQEAIRDIAIICPLASRSTSPPSGPGKRNPLVYFYLRVSSSPNCCGLKTHVELRSKSLAGSFLLLTAHTPNHPT